MGCVCGKSAVVPKATKVTAKAESQTPTRIKSDRPSSHSTIGTTTEDFLPVESTSRSVLALDNDSVRTFSASTRKTDTKSEAGKVSITNVSIRPRSDVKSVRANSDLTIEEVDSDLEDTYQTLRYVHDRKRPYSEYLQLMRKKTFVVKNGHRVHPSSDTLQFMPSVDNDNRNA